MFTERMKPTRSHLATVICVLALAASACGSDEPTTTEQPATTTVAPTTTIVAPTTTTVAPVDEPEAAAEHPCDNGQAWREGDHCRVDGQWWSQSDDGQWAESDGPPATTTTVAVSEQVAEVSPEPELGSDQDGTAPAEDASDEVPVPVTTLPPEEAIEPEPEPEQTAPEPQPEETASEPQPTPEPEAPEPEPEPKPESEPVPEPEQPQEEEPTTTTVPEPEPEPVVVEPDPQPEQPEPQPGLDFVWVRPEVGMVPEPWPLCSTVTPPWPSDCTPPAEWQRGDGTVNPDDRANDVPRQSPVVVAWSNDCFDTGWGVGNCRWLLHEMHQALDYLGADPICVANEYRAKFDYYLRAGSGANASYALRTFGWHNCATVIDPAIGDPPAERVNDIGWRLSDTGLSLAERCRAVLTDPFPDIELETRGNSVIQPAQFGSDCDAWAAYIEGKRVFSSFRVCAASMSLAEEWMEHVHGQPESYFRPYC